MTTREFAKFAINPITYEEVKPITYAQPAHGLWNQQTKNVTSEFVAIKEAKKQELKAMKEGRHRMYFDFGIFLRGNGYSLDEIYVELLDIAGNDPKMRRKAYDIMVSLYNYAGLKQKPRRR